MLRPLLLVTLRVALAVACGDASLGAPRPRVQVLDFFGLLAQGQGQLSGTIETSDGTSTSRTFTVRLIAASYATSSDVVVPAGTRRVDYAITGLAPGQYTVLAELDVNGDTRIDERDLAGYLGGSADTPVAERSAARTVTVAGQQTVSGLDFGIGRVTSCLAAAGSTCTADAQCRGVRCSCPPSPQNDAGSVYDYGGTCEATTSRCSELAGLCANACLSQGAPTQGAGACRPSFD